MFPRSLTEKSPPSRHISHEGPRIHIPENREILFFGGAPGGGRAVGPMSPAARDADAHKKRGGAPPGAAAGIRKAPRETRRAFLSQSSRAEIAVMSPRGASFEARGFRRFIEAIWCGGRIREAAGSRVGFEVAEVLGLAWDSLGELCYRVGTGGDV